MLIQAFQPDALAAMYLPNAELRIAGVIPCLHCGARYPMVINATEAVPWLMSPGTPHLQLLADAISTDHQSGHPAMQFTSNGVSVSRTSPV
jgi:hypothetical protein